MDVLASGKRQQAVDAPAARASTSPGDASSDVGDHASYMPSGLLTASQLADHWQIPVRTLYAWAKRNEIAHYRAGRLLRFDPTEVADHFRQGGFAVELTADPNQPGESAFHLLSA